MGMYLMRAIGRDGVYQSDLPDFMVFLDWKTLPWYWRCTDSFSSCGCCWWSLVPGAARLRVRLLRVPLAHQGRLLLDHHAGADLRGDAAVLPQRDRLRRQQRLHRLQAHPRHLRSPTPATRMVLFVLTGARCCSASLLLPRCWSRSQVRPRAARRSATPRPRVMFSRLRPAAATSSSSGRSRRCMCGIAGALYVPQVGHHQSRARCRPRTRSRSRSGRRSAAAAR